MHDDVLAAERREAEAMRAGDVRGLGSIWDDGFTVTPPPQHPTHRNEVLARVSGGSLAYDEFTREVDQVVEVADDVVVTLGSESLVPAAGTPGEGERMVRRFTHVWRRTGSQWRLPVRHAAFVPRP
jgi:ketosteroid isomerase-like protein